MDIRDYRPSDADAVLALVDRAWVPVFPEVNALLGPELARLLHGEDWRVHHAAEIRGVLADEQMRSWVAIEGEDVVGVASARVVDPARRIGEVHLVGVDPGAQGQGVGTALTLYAEAWLREQEMAVSFISTGGDPGHAGARALYASLGYTLFPSTQCFKAL
ncbi:MAG TPA: GNAT family N-acetyltransferase [Candidatus Nanopelagicales bacterium]|nr:GNAT family N-acetyltransferase [Candidatus Nanopelagicales bacterium]